MSERDFMDVYGALAAEHWWWNLQVNQLNLRAPVTIGPKVPCQDALEIMDREAFDQLPVLNESGYDTLPPSLL